MFKLKKKGSTLAEILIVAMIVSILCAIAYPVYTKSVTKSRVAQAVNLVELVYNKQAVSYART
ncbi:MAG: type II secretion system GspH family protein, partial [Elusimicrobiota bacterium]|nr:type II secretion system GspH family protein [Elusimicrobiota bacterium]